jgi:TonB family protein
MSTAVVRENWEGQVVDAKFSLLQRLGGSERSTVFRTEFAGPRPTKAAIKLVPAVSRDSEQQLARWAAAAKLSHPHLLRLYQSGRCRFNNTEMLYVVMEYADENLGQVLPSRPLSPDEGRVMLPPIVDALSYLHTKGLVHGRLKPSNIMAVGDQLKLSTDGLQPTGEPVSGILTASIFDAPEISKGELSAPSDLWSLGATVAVSMSQRPIGAAWTPQPGRVSPESVPEPFRRIVCECLRPIPGTRCSLQQIQEWLQPATSRPVLVPAPSVASKPRNAGRMVLIAAALLLAMALGIIWNRDRHSVNSVEPASDQSIPAVPSPSPGLPQTRGVHPAAFPGAVVERVLPDVPASARHTIQGKIRVSVQLAVSSTGEVTSATLASAGPSKYFARLALEASRHWRFKPAETDGHTVPSEWTLRFLFGRTTTEVFPVVSPR